MRKLLFTFIFLILVLLQAAPRELIFNHLGIKHGLTYSAVRDISQDSNGYIWIATLKGLNRYDGYGIQQFYSTDNGLPSNCIEKIVSIGKDSLLLGTNKGLCLYDMEKEEFKSILPPDHAIKDIMDILVSGPEIYLSTNAGLYSYNKTNSDLIRLADIFYGKMTLDINGNIWISQAITVYCLNTNGQILKRIHGKDISPAFPVEFTAIYKDSQGTIWVGTAEEGIFRLDTSQDSLIPVIFTNQGRKEMCYVRSIREDLRGNLWIGTENGLFIYNYAANTCTHYRGSQSNVQTSISDNAVYTIFRSREDIMWVGTFFGGVDYTNIKDNSFQYFIPDNGQQSLKGKAVSNIIKDSRRAMWFASEDAGITIIDANGNNRYLNTGTTPALNGNNVHALAEDPDGYMWVGNFVDGLQRIDPGMKQIKSFKNTTGNPRGICSNSIYSLYVHNSDSLIIGTNFGVDVYHFKTGEFTRFEPQKLWRVRIDDIIRDNEDNLWMAGHFHGIFSYNLKTRNVNYYGMGRPGCSQMVSNYIYSTFADSKGRVWFGTSDGGLMLYDTPADSMIVYGKESDLIQRDIYSIQEDTYGQLWLSTDNGIYSFNPETEGLTQYRVSDNLISNQFNLSAGYKDANGIIYFGSINGACSFRPENLSKGEGMPNIRITFSDFQIFGKHIKPGEESVLKKDINNTASMLLPYNMNTFTFNFLIINYKENNQSQFKCEYRLNGLEDDWNTAQQMPQSATYTNILPGRYTFQVRMVNKEGTVLAQRQVEVKIRPHFLLSNVMIGVYALFAALLIIMIIRFYRNRMRDKMDIHIERIEKNNLRELNKHKLNFFTFITHEFKTPLSILMAIFEDISIGKEKQLEKEEINIIKRNIQRLQFLINQLLDFRSVETDHASIKYVKGDIMAYGKSIFELFIPIFRQKEILFTYASEPESFHTIFDHDKIEKIISNLLSNAFKHSSYKSEINLSIRIDQPNKQIIIACHNSNSYIHPEKYWEVMQAFHKTDSTDKKYSNTGIGLALVNGLVQLLSGKIDVESSQEAGTIFKVSLPIVEDTGDMIVATDKLEITNSPDVVADTIYTLTNSEMAESTKTDSQAKLTLLLVEDTPDINKIMKSKLSVLYKVRTAYNGREAIEILRNHMVDMVISDIMMPYVDGYELTRFIKTSHEYSHIPVILITSQSSRESKMEGLSTGADAYIEKPFTFDELQLRIKNLIKSKSSIHRHYEQMKAVTMHENLSNKDEDFIQQLTAYILNNLQGENLDVDSLAEHMNISRTNLYNKLKKLLNMSTTEFVNKVKIDVAKQKISETELTFAEIAWQLGFQTPSYFSKIFKKFTGVTPNEFKKNSNLP